MRLVVLVFLSLGNFGLLAQYIPYDSVMNLEYTVQEKVDGIDTLLNKPYPDSVKSGYYHKHARYLYVNGYLHKSIKYAEQAVAFRLLLGDEEKLKRSLFNLGFFYRTADYTSKAQDTFQRLLKTGNENRYHGKAHMELGELAAGSGDFYNALLHQQQATMIFRRTGNPRDLYKNYMALSMLYALIDEKQYAKKIFAVISSIDSLGLIIVIDSRDRAILEQRKGSVFDELKSYDQAILSYEKARNYGESDVDSELICKILNNLAISRRKNGELTEAKEVLHAAFVRSDEPNLKAMVFNNMGDLYMDLNDTDSAKFCYQQSISFYTNGVFTSLFELPPLSEIKNSPYKVELLESLLSMADYEWFRYRHTEDVEFLNLNLVYLELADKLLEVLHFQSREDYSKLFWRGKASAIYTKALRACHTVNNVEKAYYFMERNKAILLLENLSERQAQLHAKLPNALIGRKKVLKKRITQLQQEAYDQNSSGNPSNDQDVNEAIFGYQTFLDSLKTEFPIYDRYLSQAPILSMHEHQSYLIDDQTNTLQYLMNATECYGLWISKDSTLLFKVSNDSLDALLKKFKIAIAVPFKSQSDIDEFKSISNQLYVSLFGSAIGTDVLEGKKLIISPNYLLNDLNFESLLVDENPTSVKDAFLINFSEISYVYSFSYLKANDEVIRKSNGQRAIFTPGVFTNDQFVTLPASIAEGQHISKLLSGNHYQDTASNKLQFQTCLETAEILHIATHATLSKESIPNIALHDSIVSDRELYLSRCNADLVVLSACGTSNGLFVKGEGVMSLARAFLYAGANSVVSTLDNINDGISGNIMVGFYENLTNQQSKSSALRSAKLQYLSTAKGSAISPYYWAPFVLIGDTGMSTLSEKNDTTRLLYVALAVCLLIGLYYFGKRMNKV